MDVFDPAEAMRLIQAERVTIFSGVPDPVKGGAVMAFVIPKVGETLTAEEVTDLARGKVANFKVPRYVEIVESFPLTGSGKVRKFKQKTYALEKYNLKEPA